MKARKTRKFSPKRENAIIEVTVETMRNLLTSLVELHLSNKRIHEVLRSLGITQTYYVSLKVIRGKKT